jgi:alpha-1,6-mannosyltransferase
VLPEAALGARRRRGPGKSAGAGRGGHLALVEDRPLRVVDVALFGGERGGALRTYLDAKAQHAATTGAMEHHVIVAGGGRERHAGGRHELASVGLGRRGGPRLPVARGAVERTLRALRPDVVLLHDPFWWPVDLAACARDLGARTVAVRHATSAVEAAALPGPSKAYLPLVRSWQRRAARQADAVMANVDTMADCGRRATMPLRLGVGEAFRPRSDVARGDHVLYVGRLSREKGVPELLEAAARSADPWPLRLVGSGPLEGTLRARAERLGLATRISFRPHPRDPERLARLYAAARCVVMPGEHETFGLAALEGAACGAPVAACSTAPARHLVGHLGHGFVPGDPADLDRAIADARSARPDPAAAAALSWRHRWDRIFAAELESLRDLI